MVGGYEITSANKNYASDNALVDDFTGNSELIIIGKIVSCIKDI